MKYDSEANGPPPRVFISATSRDLGNVRQVVKEALLTMGCLPVEQTNFPPDYRSVSGMLRARIADCQAVIHIAGFRYGAEPDPVSLPAGAVRHSYTQMEYHLAQELGKKCFIFLCPEDFPYDNEAAEPEPDEKRELQIAHREAIRQSQRLYVRVNDPQSLREKVRELQIELNELRSSVRRTHRRLAVGIAGLAAALVLLAGAVWWSAFHLPDETAQAIHADPEYLTMILLRHIDEEAEKEIARVKSAGLGSDAMIEIEKRRDALAAQAETLVRMRLSDQDADPITRETSRIIEEEGVDQAKTYLEHKKTSVLSHARKLAAARERLDQELQRELEAMLLMAELHVLSFEWARAEELLKEIVSLSPDWEEGRMALGLLYLNLNQFTDAGPQLQAAVDLAENAEQKAYALLQLAYFYQYSNSPSEADRAIGDAIALIESEYGEAAIELPDLLAFQGSQALNRGDMQSAEEKYQRAVEIENQHHGPDCPHLASQYSNLARVYLATNRIQEAELTFQRVLAIYEGNAGEEEISDIRATFAMDGLAVLYLNTSRFREAEELAEKSMGIKEQIYGSDNLGVAQSLTLLAKIHRMTGQYEYSLNLGKRSLAIYEAKLGDNHPYLNGPLNEVAMVLQAKGKLDEAEDLFRRALAIEEGRPHRESQNMALTLNNLATVLGDAGKHAESEPIFRRSLTLHENVYPPGHPEIALVKANLAWSLLQQDKLEEARAMNKIAMEEFLRLALESGTPHPSMDYAAMYQRNILAESGLDVSEVEEEMLTLFLRVLPGDHWLVGSQTNDLGVMKYRAGQFEKAAVHYGKAVEILEQQPDIPEASTMLRTARQNLASAWRELGKVEEARQLLSEVIGEWDAAKIPVPGASGRAHYHLALCEFELGDLKEAAKLVRKSIELYDQVQPISPDLEAYRRQSKELLRQVDPASDHVESRAVEDKAVRNHR